MPPESHINAAKLVLLCSAGLALLLVGIGVGVWFATRYEIAIVPKVPQQAPVQAVPDFSAASSAGLPEPNASTRAAPTTTAQIPAQNAQDRVQTPLQTQPPAQRGPFVFRFTPNERLVYRLNTRVSGEGTELGTSAPVSLEFDSALNLVTESVDGFGNGQLRASFEQTSMRGDFMGEPFEMRVSPNDAFVAQGKKAQIDTARGLGSTAGLPQLDFLQKPITMKVAPSGQVLNVSGGAGDLSSLLAAVPTVSTVEFPSDNLSKGDQWESDFALPVPGFGAPAKARIRNTLMGFEEVQGRFCAVIRQEFLSEQKSGSVNAPKSDLGEAAQFGMPLFTLQGTNMVYFDVHNGQLVNANLDLQLGMNLSQMLGDVSGLLKGLSSELSGALGGSTQGLEGLSQDLGAAPSSQNLLDLNLKIQGSMALADSAALGR